MNRYTAEKVTKEGFSIIVLKDTKSQSTAEIIPEVGNNLFTFESRGRQVIMPPDSLEELKGNAFNMYGTPILFPPNRVKEGHISYKGRVYSLPLNELNNHLHGEISSNRWEVLEMGATDDQGAFVTSRLLYAAYPHILAYFPHELSFTVTYRLFEGQLHMTTSIVNQGEDEAPFAFGLHPYFQLPYHNGKEIKLKMPVSEEWPVSEKAFVAGRPSPTDFSHSLNDGVSIADFPELECALVTLSGEDRTCLIEVGNGDYTIAYRLDRQYHYALLFRPDWSSSFSIEPYTYVTDAFNLPYEHELTGVKGILAGEEICLETSLWIAME